MLEGGEVGRRQPANPLTVGGVWNVTAAKSVVCSGRRSHCRIDPPENAGRNAERIHCLLRNRTASLNGAIATSASYAGCAMQGKKTRRTRWSTARMSRALRDRKKCLMTGGGKYGDTGERNW